MVVFIKTCGFKNTAKLVWQYPAMILTPIFSCWTMGPKKTNSTNKSCCGCWSSNDMRIGVSYLYTFLNFFITISGSLFCFFITIFRKCKLSFQCLGKSSIFVHLLPFSSIVLAESWRPSIDNSCGTSCFFFRSLIGFLELRHLAAWGPLLSVLIYGATIMIVFILNFL